MSNEHEFKNAPPHQVDTGSEALEEALRGSFKIVQILMVLLVVLFLTSGMFTVGPSEKAMILHLGKPVGEGDKALLGAGWHWAWPYPFDEVVKVKISEIQEIKSTVGWFAQSPEQEALDQEPPAGPSLNPAVDGYVVTGDGSIAHSKVTLRFHVEDPIRCVFGFAGDASGAFNLAGMSNAVQNAVNNALLTTAARFTVDEILTTDKTRFQDAVTRRVDELVRAQDLGIGVDQCTVQSRAPRQLRDAFARVNIASQNRSKEINDAHAEGSKTLAEAGSEAQRRINTAEVESAELVKSLSADVERFQKLRPSYERNSDLFKQQALIAAMGNVLTNAQFKAMLPSPTDGKSSELRLLLNAEAAQAKPQK